MFEQLFLFIRSAVEYRVASLTFTKAHYDVRQKAAAEADPPEEFGEPALEEIDHDFLDFNVA